MFFAFILILLPLLNGGPAGVIDVNDWRYGVDRTFMSRLKYFVWTFALIFQVSGVAFEAMMFVHASLKDTVFGIDENGVEYLAVGIYSCDQLVDIHEGSIEECYV